MSFRLINSKAFIHYSRMNAESFYYLHVFVYIFIHYNIYLEYHDKKYHGKKSLGSTSGDEFQSLCCCSFLRLLLLPPPPRLIFSEWFHRRKQFQGPDGLSDRPIGRRPSLLRPLVSFSLPRLAAVPPTTGSSACGRASGASMETGRRAVCVQPGHLAAQRGRRRGGCWSGGSGSAGKKTTEK